MTPPPVHDPQLARWLESGLETIEGPMAGIQIEQLLSILAFVPRSFELAITLSDGQTAQLDIAHGQLIAASFDGESDPETILERVHAKIPSSFRLKPIPFDRSPDSTEVTTDSIHDLLARIRLLTEEPITESGWRNLRDVREESDDLKPTETIDRRSLPAIPDVPTEVAARVPIERPPEPEAPPAPPESRPTTNPITPLPKRESTTLDLPVKLPIPIPAIPWSVGSSSWEQDPRFLSALVLQALSLCAISLAIGFAVGSLSTCLLAIALLSLW